MNPESTILHVEDDPDDVMLVGMAFRKAKADCKLMVVNDGEQAISYLSGEGKHSDRAQYPFPALLLMDLKLPRKSGLEVLAWARAQTHLPVKRLPIIMLTSSNQPNDIGRAYDLGVNSYLVKPADLRVLIEMVAALHHYWLAINLSPDGQAPPIFRFPPAANVPA